MRKTAKIFLILGLISGFFSLIPAQASANQIGAVSDTISWQVLCGGGSMWNSTASYKLCSSIGQSIAGVQVKWTGSESLYVYTGFWNPQIRKLSPVEEEEDFSQLPKDFDLHQNYPNPFNPTTVIEYALPKSAPVKIQIFNILGQVVRNLVDEPQEPGYKTVYWDGKDNSGSEVSSGIYFYRIVAGDFVKCKKMALLK